MQVHFTKKKQKRKTPSTRRPTCLLCLSRANWEAMHSAIRDDGDESVKETGEIPTCTNVRPTPSEHVSYSNLSERGPNGANESESSARHVTLTRGHLTGCFWLKCQSLRPHLGLGGGFRRAQGSCGRILETLGV